MPSVTKWKVVPPSISSGARGWWVSTNTGTWYGGFGPHQPFQVVVGPGPADRAEHVAAEDPGAEVGEAGGRELLVDAGAAFAAAVHLLEGAGREDPFVQRHAADAERMVDALRRAGAVAVGGDAEAVDPESGHGRGSFPRMSIDLGRIGRERTTTSRHRERTMARIESKLAALGLVLPAPLKAPPGVVLPFTMVRIVGTRAIVSGHGPLNADGSLAQPLGKVGSDLTRRAGLRRGAAHRARDPRQPAARPRRPRPHHRLDAGLRHGELGAGLRSPAGGDQRLQRARHRAVRARGRRPSAQRRRPVRAAVLHPGRDRGRGRVPAPEHRAARRRGPATTTTIGRCPRFSMPPSPTPRPTRCRGRATPTPRPRPARRPGACTTTTRRPSTACAARCMRAARSRALVRQHGQRDRRLGRAGRGPT